MTLLETAQNLRMLKLNYKILGIQYPYQEKMILMMILALLLLFATPFSNEFGGLVGVHGFYLPGVAPQGTNFLRLFVLFVLLRALNGV